MKLYYLRGALGDTTLLQQHEQTIQRLLTGDYATNDLEKLKGHELYSFRLNQERRLLFAVEKIQGHHCLIVLDYLATHDYQKSSFLRSGVLKRYLERQIGMFADLIDSPNVFEPAPDRPLFNDGRLASDGDADLALEPLEYYQNNWISLNSEQTQMLNVSFPAVCSGAAGSGKSCVALSILSSCLNQYIHRVNSEKLQARPIIYVTQSSALVAMMKKSYESLPMDEDYRQCVQIKTYNELIEKDSGVPEAHFVGAAHFDEWYSEYARKKKTNARTTGSSSSLESITSDIAYQECRIASGYEREAYLDINDMQSSLSKKSNSRADLYLVYEEYMSYLSAEKKISPSFYRFAHKPSFLLGLVDESQDFSLGQLSELGDLVEQKQIIYLMDSHQRLYDSKSVRPYLLHKYSIAESSHIQLNLTYRSPLKIVALANDLIALKHLLSGGIGDKYELKRIEAVTHDKNLGWMSILDASQLKESAWLQQHLDKPYCAIVTSAAHKEEAKRLFPQSALVLTPEEVKGLEYDIVITYKLYDESFLHQVQQRSKALGEKTEQPQHQPKAGAGDNRFGPSINRIYTSYTRAMQLLIICEPNVRDDNALFLRIKPHADERPLSDYCLTKETSGSWDSQVIAHYQAGNHALASLLFVSKLLRPEQELSDFIKQHIDGEKNNTKAFPKADLNTKSNSNASHPEKPLSQKKENVSLTQKTKPSPMITVAPISIPQSTALPPAQVITPSKIGGYVDSLLNDFTEKRLMIVLNLFGQTIWNDPSTDSLKSFLNENQAAQRVFCAVLVNHRHLLNQVPLRETQFMSSFPKFKSKLNDLKKIRQDIDDYCSKNSYSDEIPLLHLSVLKKDEKLIKKLCTLGADLNKPAIDGVTPAFVAAQNGHDSTLGVLKKLGADLNKPMNNGATPAFVAAQNGHDSTLGVLKKLGADLNKPMDDGVTPALVAALQGDDSTLRVLKNLGADLNKPRDNGATPAFIAAQLGHDSTLRVLYELKADLNKPMNHGATPAYIAAENGYNSTLRVLKELEADLNKPMNNGTTPAFVAAQVGHNSTLRVLYELKADLNKPMDDGATPAYIAAHNGYDSTLRVLYELGADLNKPMNNGATPALIAAHNGYDSTLRVLKILGADLNIPMNNGATPALVAVQNGHVNIVKKLIDLGARLDCKHKMSRATLIELGKKCSEQVRENLMKKLIQDNAHKDDDCVLVSLLDVSKIMGNNEIVALLSDTKNNAFEGRFFSAKKGVMLDGRVIPNFFCRLKWASSLLGWFGVSAHGDSEEIPDSSHQRDDILRPRK